MGEGLPLFGRLLRKLNIQAGSDKLQQQSGITGLNPLVPADVRTATQIDKATVPGNVTVEPPATTEQARAEATKLTSQSAAKGLMTDLQGFKADDYLKSTEEE